jgi:HAD superfamily hydrolase (TIGR01509 family)
LPDETKKKPAAPRPAALLDVDGTLVDSNDAHARAWVEVLAEDGYEVPFAQVRRLIGKGGDKLVPEVTGRHDEEWTKQLGERRQRIFFDRHLASIEPFPRVRELLECMKASGLALVIATSANEEELERLLDIAGVADLLDEQATKDDAKRSKPDPDIIGAALKRAGVDASRALMLGDTPYDVEAAQRAGVGTVALESGGWHQPDLGGAVAIYRDAAALLAAFEQSPFARLAGKAHAA